MRKDLKRNFVYKWFMEHFWDGILIICGFGILYFLEFKQSLIPNGLIETLIYVITFVLLGYIIFVVCSIRIKKDERKRLRNIMAQATIQVLMNFVVIFSLSYISMKLFMWFLPIIIKEEIYNIFIPAVISLILMFVFVLKTKIYKKYSIDDLIARS